MFDLFKFFISAEEVLDIPMPARQAIVEYTWNDFEGRAPIAAAALRGVPGIYVEIKPTHKDPDGWEAIGYLAVIKEESGKREGVEVDKGRKV